jgi:hypothetical protein
MKHEHMPVRVDGHAGALTELHGPWKARPVLDLRVPLRRRPSAEQEQQRDRDRNLGHQFTAKTNM